MRRLVLVLPPHAGDESSRLLITEALFDLAVERGAFTGLSEDDVCERIGVTSTAFHENFASFEEALFWAFDRRAARCLVQVQAAHDLAETWPDTMRAAAYQTAWWLRENRRTLIVGSQILTGAGELARARRDAVLMACASYIDEGRRLPEAPPSLTRSTAESVVGVVVGSLDRAMNGGRGEPISLVPQFMYMAVRPYLGDQAAMRELSMPPPKERPVPSEPEQSEVRGGGL